MQSDVCLDKTETPPPPVTAIVPTYNRARYLSEAIRGILGQTLPPSQVLVVDDGSTDNTRDVVAAFGSSVQYISKSNGGKSSALNLGLQHATGASVWIFDDDDLPEPDALERLAAALHAHPECGFSYGDYDLFSISEDGKHRYTPVPFPSVQPDELYFALMERSFILQGGLLVRKLCYDAVGPFDESLVRSQDLEMMLRLARRFRGVKIRGITYHMRQHAGTRGSQAAPVAANRMVEGWVKADRVIFSRIYSTHQLSDFLPFFDGSELTIDQTLTALIRRCCIMARKGIWGCAADDLRRVSEIGRGVNRTKLTKEQTEILRRVFDLFSYAPHTFDDAGEFRRALKQVKPGSLRRDIRAALLWSLPFTIGAACLHRQKTNFYRFLRIYARLATPDVLIRTLVDSSFLAAGFELIKRRRNQAAFGGSGHVGNRC